jgi:hypothetical protein
MTTKPLPEEWQAVIEAIEFCNHDDFANRDPIIAALIDAVGLDDLEYLIDCLAQDEEAMDEYRQDRESDR